MNLSRFLGRARALAVTLVVATPGIQYACGPPDQTTPTATPTTPTTPTQPTAEQSNPCPSTPSSSSSALASALGASTGLGAEKRAASVDGHVRPTVLDAVWAHRIGLERGLILPTGTRAATEDVGDIAVMQDEGDLILRSNTYDLRDVTLRFEPNSAGGYDTRRVGPATYRSPVGQQVPLGDDDTAPLTFPFEFPYYDGAHASAFVNSDGNLTFVEGDDASTARGISRLLTGWPRVAPFLADLDPSAGGAVYARSAADAVTVTWCAVPEFDNETSAVTVQVSLLPNGNVEMTFDREITTRGAVVGLSPGRTFTLEAVDLSDTGPTPGGAAAVGERFSMDHELDVVAVAARFAASHPDIYDQIVIWANRPVVFDAFAYEITIANAIQGIGQALYATPSDFASDTLESLVVMGWLGKYSEDLSETVAGEATTMAVLGHETGHRWLAFLEFSDHNRQRSEELLGRQRAHWSFFVDSDASVMEGNDIEDLGGGEFRTVAAEERYSALDQYAMGLRHDYEVPPFFYVESPTNVSPPARSTTSPEVGVTFNGTRRDVLIQHVIEVEGPRVPSADRSPRVHRQAFIYVVGQASTADPDDLAKLDTIRRQWEPWFSEATDGRMRVETRLNPGASANPTP
ncbi:MAG: hypothetical protein F4W89_01455 [Acidobacteria bacterium]|nr:hypothetical protein [Acidobacteriota bacterium]